MKASIHISTNMVEVIAYTKTGSSVSVKGYYTYPLPEECVINGVILDTGPVTEGLKSLKAKNPTVFKDVSLILDGSFVFTKKITVPGKLNKWRYDQVIRDEFTDVVSEPENLVCDHFPLTINEDGSKQILACAVEKAHAETYFSILNAAGIVPSTVRLGIQAILRYIGSKTELKNTPFVLNIVDGVILMSMIFQNGVNVFLSRTRLYGEDRNELVGSTLGSLSGIIQFNKSQNFDDLTNCFYIGLSDSDMDLIELNNTYPDIKFGLLGVFKGAKGTEILPPDAHIAFLNTLIPDSEPDLLHSIKMLEKVKKRNRPKKRWIPILVSLILVLAGAVAALFYLVTGIEREVRELRDFMNSSKVQSEQAELDSLNRDTAKVTDAYNQALQQIEEDSARPQLTKQLLDTIVQTGGNTVSVSGITFSDDEGLIRVAAVAATEYDAGYYVDMLRNNAMIDTVVYLGYHSDYEGSYSFSIEVRAY